MILRVTIRAEWAFESRDTLADPLDLILLDSRDRNPIRAGHSPSSVRDDAERTAAVHDRDRWASH
jgi:hypothetical protein